MCILERRRTEVVIMNLLLPVSIQSECDFDKRRTQKITAPFQVTLKYFLSNFSKCFVSLTSSKYFDKKLVRK